MMARPILRCRLLLLGLLALVCGAAPAHAADPEWAAAGSFLLPGVGQAMNEDFVEGGVHASLYLVLANQYLKRIEHPDYIPHDERENETLHTIRINHASAVADGYGTATLNLAFYSSFAAYRDARSAPEYEGAYETPTPQESLADLALAPFNWRLMIRPTTIAPLMIPLYFAVTPADSERLVFQPDDSITRSELARRFFVQHGMVAVGEEAFFRGFLNNGLSDALGRYWGLASSSVIFGLGHSGTGAQATGFGAALFGAYLGWIQQENGYAIDQGVAIHFWWNFLTSLALLKEREGGTVPPVTIYLRF